MLKKDLRKKMLAHRKKLLASERNEKSRQIRKQLLALPAFRTAKTILTYLPLPQEPDTLPLLSSAWSQKKLILIPVTNTKKESLILSQLNDLNEVTPQNYNLLEPLPEFLRPMPPQLVDLCLLPGLAFDLEGYRLGYGRGYYDRFLPQLRPTCLKIGLAYDWQIVPLLPREKHDLPVDLIITETTLYAPNEP